MSRGRLSELSLTEDCLRIDLAEPAFRGALKLGARTAGTWTWSRGGERIGLVDYAWNGATTIPVLTLNFTVRGQSVRQSIATAFGRPRFGGVRLWFVCPFTGDRARVLYLPPGGDRFAGRRAWRLTYRSRRESGATARLVRTLARLDAMGPGPRGGNEAEMLRWALTGLEAEARDERRWEAWARRNAVRRIRRRERRGI